MDISSLANALLLQHRADYSEAHGYAYEFRLVSGYSEDEVAAAYEELARAGLMEPAETTVKATTSRRRYRLTGTSRASTATLQLP